ncbi:MAG TPA: HAMP domain-containing sensor histidine kinase [Candidatus Dormibacteraeota bacterium]|nr:HAMP domain-containing sensor histidine kinase [Candidatus Dormibacteraeota bacterium]
MIDSSRREGQIGSEFETPSAHERAWAMLDRRSPLALKLVMTVVAVTALGAVLFAYLLTQARPTALWIGVAGAAVATFEAALLIAAIDYGVLRRVRRMHRHVATFERNGERGHLAEASEPPGRDELFNLARDIDLRLTELDERERAGTVVTRLGMLALQGTNPSDLTTHALDLTRDAAGLDQCLLIDREMLGVLFSSGSGDQKKMSESDLPVWLAALARSSARSRRPVLAGRHGHAPRFWDGQSAPQGAAAAFVPMPGKHVGAGVMVGLARPGGQITTSTVGLVEGVATALSESLERKEASRARQESEDKSKALATVSHEMRNPLNAMLGFSDLLLDGSAGSLTDKQRLYLQHIDEASRHMLRLVNDYLDLARLESGSLPLTIEAVEVGPEVRNVLELLGPSAEARHVVLRSDVVAGTVAQADRLRLRQVLINLMVNAIRSTPSRGHVRIQVAGGSNGVRISVLDTGLGIPTDRQHLVFTEFAELRPGEENDGTGLGLALSRRFVEAMGGFIRFTSSDGAGTIFDVWLPGENTPRTADETAAPSA